MTVVGVGSLQHPLSNLFSDPWELLNRVLEEPLHPGGADATMELLDRANVTSGARILDVGCGAGYAIDIAATRGAKPIGLDRQPRTEPAVRGDYHALPIQDDAVEVVLAECVLCLTSDLSTALAEIHRVLVNGGRLALSDVLVEEELPDLPPPLPEILCLSSARSRTQTLTSLEKAGFSVETVRNHREDLLTMRDRFAATLDYRGLLESLGTDGQTLLAAIEEVESRIEAGDIMYLSVVAES